MVTPVHTTLHAHSIQKNVPKDMRTTHHWWIGTDLERSYVSVQLYSHEGF